MIKTVEIAAGLRWVTVLMVGLLGVAGCSDSDLEEAKKEAREAKTTVAKLQVQLAKVVEDHEALKAELNVVRQTRDDLQKQVDGLIEERDSALGVAEQAEQVITNLSDRAAGQTNTQASLQKEIGELKALVAEQQALIEELQAGVSVDPNLIDLSVDPNEILEEVEG